MIVTSLLFASFVSSAYCNRERCVCATMMNGCEVCMQPSAYYIDGYIIMWYVYLAVMLDFYKIGIISAHTVVVFLFAPEPIARHESVQRIDH